MSSLLLSHRKWFLVISKKRMCAWSRNLVQKLYLRISFAKKTTIFRIVWLIFINFQFLLHCFHGISTFVSFVCQNSCSIIITYAGWFRYRNSVKSNKTFSESDFKRQSGNKILLIGIIGSRLIRYVNLS